MRSSFFSSLPPLLFPSTDLFLLLSFYVIESGMLRANYTFADRSNSMVESMVAGTVAGELSFLSRTKRNTDVVAERDSVLWKMDVQAHEELGKKEGWTFGRRFEEVVLKIAVAETEVLMVRFLVLPSLPLVVLTPFAVNRAI
jgi:CRP-like cAMP-binding protein